MCQVLNSFILYLKIRFFYFFFRSQKIRLINIITIYCFLTTIGEPLDRTMVDDIWQRHISSKVSVFVWRLLRNRLFTKDNLVRRQVIPITDTVCITGCGGLETSTHFFLHCDILNSLWYHVWHWLHISSVSAGNIRQHFIQFTSMARLPRFTHTFMKVI